MAVRTVPIQIWRAYLRHLGLEYKRKTGSHEVWDRADGSLPRPVVVPIHGKEIHAIIIRSNLKTLGVSMDDFESWLRG